MQLLREPVVRTRAPDQPTDAAIFALNQEQRAQGIKPQCDINGTPCGSP